jgi:hypothetical protein
VAVNYRIAATDASIAGRDRQPGRDLTLSSVKGYESGVLKVKKEILD